MTYESEFDQTEYRIDPKHVEQLLAEGFEDTSWHNDVCPSFSKEIAFDADCNEGDTVRIWIDAVDPQDRECGPEMPRYRVDLYTDTMSDGVTILETENFGEALDKALEVGDERQTDKAYGRCGQCDHIEATENIGTTCRACGRGIIE